MKQLNNKTAVITGAARGIGAAIANAYVAEGARVVIADIDGAAPVQSVEGGRSALQLEWLFDGDVALVDTHPERFTRVG